MEKNGIYIIWKVRCLDRKGKRFFDRYLIPNLSEMDPSVRDMLLSTIRENSRDPTIATYPSHFHEVHEKEIPRCSTDATVFHCLFLPGYVED